MKIFVALAILLAGLHYFDALPRLAGTSAAQLRAELLDASNKQCPIDGCESALEKIADRCFDGVKSLLSKEESEDVAYCFLGDAGEWILNKGCEVNQNFGCSSAVAQYYDDCYETAFSDMPTTGLKATRAMHKVINCVNTRAGSKVL